MGSKWTKFMDMHSGGGTKEPPYEYIFIEAPEEEAKVIFQNRFGHNPERVTCTCCGDDYSIDEDDSLREATAFYRGCDYVYRDQKGQVVPRERAWILGKGVVKGVKGGYEERPAKDSFNFHSYCTLKEFLKRENVLVIRKKDIKTVEREGKLKQSGYVWID